MAETEPKRKHKRRWIAWTVGSLVLGLAILAGVLTLLAYHIEPFLRAAVVNGLQDRFRTRVEMDSFHVRLGNGLHGEWGVWATGKGLRIWPPHRVGGDHPLEVATQSVPLIQLQEFRFHTPLSFKSDKPIHISMVRLTGLQIDIPPRSERDNKTGFEAAGKGKPRAAHSAKNAPGERAAPDAMGKDATATSAPPPVSQNQPSSGGMLSRVEIDRIECDSARLIMETDKPDKLPMELVIANLHVMHVSSTSPMDFQADVLNPKPKGVVHTIGRLGPWATGDPGETPVSGTYRFPSADMGVFKGIAGMLSSDGSYDGTLRNISVQGQADVPNFSLTHFGNALPLHTKFQARVDGTTGDTWLDKVDAVLGQSQFTTNGEVVRMRLPETPARRAAREANGVPQPLDGHNIELKVNVPHGRMEDFLRLTGHTPTPLMTGILTLNASLQIPPGPETVHRRIRLDGSFKLDDVVFTNDKVRDKIRDLSLRGLGKPGELKKQPDEEVASNMRGDFHMANAVILFPDLEYDVPGASIRLKGNYELDGFMYFGGSARMKATVSQMVGGWKGFLLKPADHFFKHDGAGTEVGIVIKGSHTSPQFSVDLGHSKLTSPERPGEKRE